MKRSVKIYITVVIVGLLGVIYDIYVNLFTYQIPTYIVTKFAISFIVLYSIIFFKFKTEIDEYNFEKSNNNNNNTENKPVNNLIWPITIVICISIASFAYIYSNRYQVTHNGYGLVDKFSQKVYILNQETKEYE